MRVPSPVGAVGSIFVAAALLHVPGVVQAQGQLRIAYVDSQILIEQAPGAQEAQEEFDRQMQSFTRELDALGAEIDTLVSQYQQQQSTLLPNVRQAREAEIQQREGRYQQRLGEIQQEADVARQRLMQPILQQITETIEALRAEGGYAIIFDVAGQSIVAADPALDLTEEVVSRLSAPASPAP